MNEANMKKKNDFRSPVKALIPIFLVNYSLQLVS